MKLVTRLTVAFLLVVIAAISLAEWRRFTTEVADFEADVDRSHLLVARSVADAVEAIVPRDGLAEAQRMVDSSGQHHPTALRIRWVCLDEGTSPPAIPCAELASVQDARSFTAERGRRVTVVPVRLAERPGGAIEVSESAQYETDWARAHVTAAVQLALGLIFGMAAFAFILGWLLVARPTRALVSKSREMGRGEFKPDLTLGTGDEFEQLAKELNAACAQLEHAQAEKAKATEARERATEHLRHADRLATVGRLATGLAHELGTPLNVIEARAGLIVDDLESSETTRSSAKLIITETEQVTRLVRQLLVFARPRVLEPTPVFLDSIARTVVDLIGPLAARKPVTLDVSGLSPSKAAGDEVLLQQALTNLVVNALHACAANGHVWVATGQVERSAPEGGERHRFATLSVRDDGVGIATEQQRSIFEPFFTTKPAGEGTGLGLPIVSSIIEEHGGFLTLESAPGRGSTFTIHLPEASR